MVQEMGRREQRTGNGEHMTDPFIGALRTEYGYPFPNYGNRELGY